MAITNIFLEMVLCLILKNLIGSLETEPHFHPSQALDQCNFFKMFNASTTLKIKTFSLQLTSNTLAKKFFCFISKMQGWLKDVHWIIGSKESLHQAFLNIK